MAILLAWISWDARVEMHGLWPKLVARASGRAEGTSEVHAGTGYRALAIRTRAFAPAPLIVLRDGGAILRDGERFDGDADGLQAPMDSPAAVIEIDPIRCRVRLLRDRLGQRPLCWARVPGGVLIASGEDILRAHPDVDDAFDRNYLAAYFGASAPPAEATVFRGIANVAPGQALTIDPFGEHRELLLSAPIADAFRWPDAIVAHQLASHLKAAVAFASRDSSRLGLSLSSGLDSGALAAYLTGTRGATPLAVSYGCQHPDGPDERELAAALAEQCGLEFDTVSADAAGPLSVLQRTQICPDTPIANPYRAIKTLSYQRFAAAGVDVVLTGNFADHLNAEPSFWLGDALRHGRLAMVAASYWRVLVDRGWSGLWREPGWRALAHARRAPVFATAPWLRDAVAAESLARKRAAIELHANWPRAQQAAHALGSYAAFDAAGECYFSQRHGIEVRHPFRHWALVQLALSLSGYQSWRGNVSKFAMRLSLVGRLPEAWRTRGKSADMQPLFERSIRAQHALLAALIEQAQPIWSEYIEPRVAHTALAAEKPTGNQAVLLWLLAGFGQWLHAGESGMGRDSP